MGKRIKVYTILGLILLLMFLIKMLLQEQFDSVESFQKYIKRFGIFAPLVLVIVQAVQVVVPVLPGYLGCAAGSIAFGANVGFWCNYIGISLGSIIAFFLARRYGLDIVLAFFPQQQYDKWQKRVGKSKRYGAFLFVATLLPFFPDDFLCYFSGVMKMRRKVFIWIIILGKPWCILAYSLAFGLIK